MLTFLKRKIDNTKKAISRGFTLLEMIVVVAIFGILTAIIVFNYGDFNAEIIVTNMAYEVALTTRQAQIFGLGVRRTGGTFDEAYGIYADVSSGETQDFIFFGDTQASDRLCKAGASNCNCGGGGDECLERLTMQRNIVIDRIQVDESSASSCEDIDRLSITFKRPNTEAHILDQDDPSALGETDGLGNSYNSALLTINSPDGRQRHVLVRKSGQISVIGDQEVDDNTNGCSIL